MIALINNWLDSVQLRCSPETLKTYRSVMHIFIDTLPLKITPDKIAPLHIENFVQSLSQTHKITTANEYLAILKAFYKWTGSFSGGSNPTDPVLPLREPEVTRRILSESEYQAILNKASGKARDAIQFLANTGLRRNEFRFLIWQDFNGEFVRVTGKGNKTRFVPLNILCKTILNKTRQGNSPLFIEKFRPYNALYKLCTQLSQKANIPYFTPHSFRHFFATRLIRKGVPLIVVSKILGHYSVEITEKIYVHLQADDLKVTNCLDS